MPISQLDLQQLEARINAKLAVHHTAFRLSVHFSVDRVNDPRNVPEIKLAELDGIFNRLIGVHLKSLLALNDGDTFNIRCTKTDINMPCAVRKKPQAGGVMQQDNIVITVMRKKNFVAKDAVEFKV